MLSACATTRAPDSDVPASERLPAAEAPETAPATDPDVMYHVMAGEVQGHAGDFEKSSAEYLAAALESEDPAIARRATQVAISSESWLYASMAADRWVLLQPDSLDARQTAIQVMLLNGDYVAAEYQMSELLDIMGDEQSRAWSIITAQLANAGDPERAGNILAHLISTHEAAGNADALFARSQLAARSGDMQDAFALAEQALETEPGRAELHAWAGRLAVNLRFDDVAFARYERANQLKPHDRTIASAYAELLRRKDRLDEALRVLENLPDSPEVRFGRVGFALSSDLVGEAEAIYRGFYTRSYPDARTAAFQAARAAEMLGYDQEAIDWYAQVKSGDRALVAVLRRAVLMAENDDLEGARNLLAQTRVRRDPSVQLETYLTESQILTQAGQGEEAWQALTQALAVMPGHPDVLYGRALLSVELGRIDEAEQDLRQILEEDPRNAAVLNALGYTLADLTDRLDEAEQLIRAALDLQPEEASILDSMGWVAYRQGRHEEALAYLEQAWIRDNNPEIAAHLGEVLWVLGRKEDAKSAWRLGLERGPDDPVLKATISRFGAEL